MSTAIPGTAVLGKVHASSEAALDLVGLRPLMQLTEGRPEVKVGVIDGPVARHPALVGQSFQVIPGRFAGFCAQAENAACLHGTFTVGLLTGLCPGCTLLLRPIFPRTPPGVSEPVTATPEELATAILECVDHGAQVVNLSVALIQLSSGHREPLLDEALDYAMRRGVLVVAAAGNEGSLTGSALTRHPWVIPVAAYDLEGRPLRLSNLGPSVGRRGLGASGVSGLGPQGGATTGVGTSVAAPFVTAAAALLISAFPHTSVAAVKRAMTRATRGRRGTVVPPLLDAWAAHRILAEEVARGAA